MVAGRLALVAHGSIGAFVLAGAPLAHARRLPSGIPFHAHGYDGQFFYRLARDPADLAHSAYGVSFDTSYRAARIGYPALAWVLSLGGRAALVPWALVALNVLALSALALEGAVIARQSGRRPEWGLLLAGYFGFVLSLSRDTAEPTEVAFAIGGLLALRSRRAWAAGLLLCAAVLTRETATLLVAAVGLVDLQRRWAARGGRALAPRRLDLVPWVAPSVAFFGWQLSLWGLTGHLPLHSDARGNLAVPLLGLVSAAAHRLGQLPSRPAELWCLQVVVVIAAWLLALLRALSPRRPIPSRTAAVERLALAFNVALVLFLPYKIWDSVSSDFRSFGDSFVLAVLVVLSSRARLRALVPFVSVAWIVVALFRVKVL